MMFYGPASVGETPWRPIGPVAEFLGNIPPDEFDGRALREIAMKRTEEDGVRQLEEGDRQSAPESPWL